MIDIEWVRQRWRRGSPVEPPAAALKTAASRGGWRGSEPAIFAVVTAPWIRLLRAERDLLRLAPDGSRWCVVDDLRLFLHKYLTVRFSPPLRGMPPRPEVISPEVGSVWITLPGDDPPRERLIPPEHCQVLVRNVTLGSETESDIRDFWDIGVQLAHQRLDWLEPIAVHGCLQQGALASVEWDMVRARW